MTQPRPSSPAFNRKAAQPMFPAPGNKFQNWYRRNVKKDLAPVVYHDGVDAAIREAGL